MLKQVINVLVMLIFILSLYYYPWKTISFICILGVILIIIAILAAKKMLPLFIEKMLKKGKDTLKVFKIIYLILYSLPCLLSDLFKGAKDEYDKQPQGIIIIDPHDCLYIIAMYYQVVFYYKSDGSIW